MSDIVRDTRVLDETFAREAKQANLSVPNYLVGRHLCMLLSDGKPIGDAIAETGTVLSAGAAVDLARAYAKVSGRSSRLEQALLPKPKVSAFTARRALSKLSQQER